MFILSLPVVSHATWVNCSVVLWGKETSSIDGPFFLLQSAGSLCIVRHEGKVGGRDEDRKGEEWAGTEIMLMIKTLIKSS